jgi:hypothetical protein
MGCGEVVGFVLAIVELRPNVVSGEGISGGRWFAASPTEKSGGCYLLS